MNRLPGFRGRKMLAVLLVVAGVFAIFEVYCLRFAYVHLRVGDDARIRGNMGMARVSWESAASRPAPFNVFAREAMGRLVEHEKALEADGRLAEALRACFSIKGIARSTDGYRHYYKAQEEYVDGRIPDLARGIGVELSPDRYTLYRPIRGWAAHLAILLFAGFVLSAFQAIRSDGKRDLILYVSLSACSFLLWLLSLGMA